MVSLICICSLFECVPAGMHPVIINPKTDKYENLSFTIVW